VSQPPTADAGARYDGFRVPGWRAEFTVSRNGSSVREYAIGFTEGHCSNGMRFTSGNVARIADGIAHDGQASGSRHFARAYILSPSGKRIDGHETMSFNLQFAGDRLDGSFHDLFIASHLRCSSGWVPFTAYRDGTPQAPLIGKLVDTGVYRTTAHIGFGDPMTMHVYLPQQDVASMTVTRFLDCHIGNTRRFVWRFFNLPIHYRGGRATFGIGGHGTARPGHGVIARFHWKLTGRFTHEGDYQRQEGWYGVAVGLEYVVNVYRDGVRVNSCNAGYPYSGGSTGVGPND
jgi:hypothetical protein